MALSVFAFSSSVFVYCVALKSPGGSAWKVRAFPSSIIMAAGLARGKLEQASIKVNSYLADGSKCSAVERVVAAAADVAPIDVLAPDVGVAQETPFEGGGGGVAANSRHQPDRQPLRRAGRLPPPGPPPARSLVARAITSAKPSSSTAGDWPVRSLRPSFWRTD